MVGNVESIITLNAMTKKISSIILSALLISVCAFGQSVEKLPYGKTKDGTEIYAYVVKNKNGLSFTAITYGATLTEIRVPDKNGKLDDIALGFDSLSGYESSKNPYFGALVGRYGNRISGASFEIDGKEFKVSANEKGKCLHGGVEGFNRKIWRAEEIRGKNFAGVKFAMTSPDSDQGFPGKLDVVVIYTLSNKNALSIEYFAQTDKATPVNLTQHTYFNLAGAGNGTVLDTVAFINAKDITPVDKDLITDGSFMPVKNTPFDFYSKPVRIGDGVGKTSNTQISFGGGFDHNFVITRKADGKMRLAGIFTEPNSGRVLKVYTTEPGVQFYTCNSMDGSLVGKGGKKYSKYGAFAFETQHFPDSPNKETYPSTILEPGDIYHSKTVWVFGAE